MMSTETMIDTDCHIRWIYKTDLAQILKIENEAFEFPWSEKDWIRLLSQRNCTALVAEVNGCVVAYAAYEFHANRYHVLNFAVRADCRRRSIGSVLVGHLKGKLNAQRNRLMLEVRDSNLDAQLFFRAQGFRCVSVIRDFYEDTDDDAYLFQFRLTEAKECKGKK